MLRRSKRRAAKVTRADEGLERQPYRQTVRIYPVDFVSTARGYEYVTYFPIWYALPSFMHASITPLCTRRI